MQFLSFSGVTVLGAVLKTDPKRFGSFEPYLKWTVDNAWWLIVALSLFGLILRGVTNSFGDPAIWASVRRILEKFRNEAFSGIEGDPLHHHRVTLYRKCWRWRIDYWRSRWWPWGSNRWPWSGWMVPVARSSRTTQRMKTVYLAPDDADRSEGIVGWVWQTNEVRVIELPEVGQNPTPEQLQAYADASMMPLGWVQDRAKKGAQFPRVLCGIPVEVDNKLWGVIVLDSRRSNTINYKSRAWEAYTTFAQWSLSELLRHV